MTAQDLKNSILQLAVQGKLVQQYPEDGTATDLLKHIAQKKSDLIKDGALKKEKPLPAVDANNLPFDVPENWVWIRLGDFCSIYNGNSINAGEKAEKTRTASAVYYRPHRLDGQHGVCLCAQK